MTLRTENISISVNLPSMRYYHKLKESILAIERDVTKFYERGNKAAAVRARHALKSIKAVAQAARQDIQDTKYAKGLM